MIRVIHLPAIDKTVTLAAYVRAVKMARENPDRTFSHGLTAWWPCTGREIVEQFRSGMHDRINQRVPYQMRGRAARPEARTRQAEVAAAVPT